MRYDKEKCCCECENVKEVALKEIQNEGKHKGEHFINLLLTRLWCQKFKIGECHATLHTFS